MPMYPTTAVLIAATYLLNAQRTFANDDSSNGDLKRDTTDTVMAWILFPILGVEILLACSFMIGCIYQYLTVKRKVKDTYAALPPSEKEKIHALQNEIEEVLDPNLPGQSKYIAAWEDWSEPDMQGLQKELKGLLRLPQSPYVMTRYFLQLAELAMRSARKAKKHREKQADKAKKAIDLAAMVWGIYWAEEVIKAREKKEMERQKAGQDFKALDV
jgi:hypothetical protein